MKKHILWGLILIFLSPCCFAQTFQWANSESYSSNVQRTNKIIHDKSGNTFISGNNGQYADSIFIVKYDSAGNKLWAKNYSGYGEIASLCSDNSGNLFAPLFISGSNIIIDGQQYDRAYGADFFTLFIKYDTNGNILWIKQTKLAMALSERTDKQDNIIVTGNVVATVHLDNNITLTTTSLYGTNYLAKFNTNGECIWAQENDGGWYPFCNPKGDVFTIGGVDTVTTVGQGSQKVTLYPSNGDEYFAKYDSIGKLIWVKQNYTSGIATDNEGNLYDFEPDRSNITKGSWKNTYLIKYDSQGNQLWKRTHLYIDNLYKLAMKCGANGDLYMTGGFSNYMAINGNTYNDGGNTRAFVAKIDSSGALKWISISSGTGAAGAKDVTISDENEIYITGDIGGGESIFGSYSTTQSSGVFTAKIIDSTNPTSIKELHVANNSLLVYPNPSNTIFTISYQTNNSANLIFNVTNSNGQILYKDLEDQFSGQYLKTIDLSDQPKGIYFIEIICGGQRKSKKIVLQ